LQAGDAISAVDLPHPDALAGAMNSPRLDVQGKTAQRGDRLDFGFMKLG